MRKQTNAQLDIAVKRSLGYNPILAAKYSIVECAKNSYLDPEFDPFHDLMLTLLMQTLNAKHNLKKD